MLMMRPKTADVNKDRPSADHPQGGARSLGKRLIPNRPFHGF